MKILFLLAVIAFQKSIATSKLLSIFIKSVACDDPTDVRPAFGCTRKATRIRVNGVDQIAAKRGYNVVVINGDSGNVEESRSFDTYRSNTEANYLASFLNDLGKGKLVLVAVRDEGRRKMTDAAYQALEAIGAVNPLKIYRSSFALIGWTGYGGLSSVTQVLLAWGINYGCPVLPKSVNEGRIKQNLETFNVKLQPEDITALANIGKKFRYLLMNIFYLDGETPEIYWDGEQ